MSLLAFVGLARACALWFPFADLSTSLTSWYFYQKTKNYRVMYSGVLGGLKTGGRIGLWTATFVGLEEGIEAGVRRSLPESANSYRTRWASGGLAGLGLATAAGQICKNGSARRSADLANSAPMHRSTFSLRCTKAHAPWSFAGYHRRWFSRFEGLDEEQAVGFKMKGIALRRRAVEQPGSVEDDEHCKR